jgi:putative ABC transport system permease protein
MSVLKTFKISFFLASRQIKNANLWVNILIIFIMAVTFLNLVFISGLLEGLVTGASKDSREHYSGEIIITPEDEKVNIVNTTRFIEEINNISQIDSYTVRYLQGAQIEASYSPFQEPNVERNLTNGILTGINFENENKVTDLEKFIIDGEYVYSNPQNKVLIGSGLLAEYDSAIEGGSLEGVNVGDKIKITASGTPKEYVVSGILKAKLSQINNRVFIDRQQFISLTGRSPQLSDEIAISLVNPQEVELVKDMIKEVAKNSQAKTETWQESQGQFFEDLSMTFTILGAVIGAIGLAVASVTLFIVIFINAISRERYIGILKGIGVDSSIIKYSYVFQSIFYALIGSVIGLLLLYTVLVPYFSDNPIDFPFSDGILDVTVDGVIIRVLILFISSVAAGFIPSHLIVKKNTIDSILGR